MRNRRSKQMCDDHWLREWETKVRRKSRLPQLWSHPVKTATAGTSNLLSAKKKILS